MFYLTAYGMSQSEQIWSCGPVPKPRAWGPEAVQADSPRHLEAHHVISQARLQLPRGLRRPPRPREEHHVWPGSQRGILTGTVTCTLNSALRGDHCPAVGSAPGTSWDLKIGRAHV